MRSLTGRLTLAMGGVALVSALLAGVLTAPLLTSATEDAVREPMGRQAALLARLPTLSLGPGRLATVGDRTDLTIGIVGPTGTAPAGLAAALSPAEIDALRGGSAVSTTARYDGRSVLVEARPGRGGRAVVVATDADVAEAASATLRRRVLLAIGLGLLAALGVAGLVAARIGRPLTRTAAAARRLAAGERGLELTPSGTTEVDDVATALTSLDRALAASEARQRDFLLSVSHELRTPMTAVRGYAQALADGMIGAEELPDVAGTMVRETERMDRYVADLLALARLQADDFAVTRGPVDVAAVLAQTAAAWGERARHAGIDVRVTSPQPLPAGTDPTRLRQVLDALLDNAVRVGASGDVVVLVGSATTTPTGRGVRIEVRDSGPGLTAEDRAVAFEPGVLHARYAGRRPGGHGLGLAIVHRLVTRLGGTITADVAPEGGASFVIDLPG